MKRNAILLFALNARHYIYINYIMLLTNDLLVLYFPARLENYLKQAQLK